MKCWRTDKSSFSTKEKAETAMTKVNKSRSEVGKKKMKQVYQCPHCDRWHLTTQNKYTYLTKKKFADRKKSWQQYYLQESVEKRIEFLKKINKGL